MTGWGEGPNLDVGQASRKRLNPGEIGSDPEDVNGIVAIFMPHRHDRERFAVCPEVWDVS